MKKNVPLALAYRLINHGPVLLVSTFYKGRANVCTIAWAMPVDSDLVAVVVSDENYTFRCIRKTGEFVLNVPPRKMLKRIMQCGSVSGSECDKFKKFGLKVARARRVKAPLIEECIGHLECKIIEGKGRLAEKYNIFIARVVAASAERGLFTRRWNIRRPCARTLHHLGGNVFAVPSKTVCA